MEISRNKQFINFKLHAILSSMMKSHTIPLHPAPSCLGCESSLCPAYSHCICCDLPIRHCAIDYHQIACRGFPALVFKEPWFYWIMCLKNSMLLLQSVTTVLFPSSYCQKSLRSWNQTFNSVTGIFVWEYHRTYRIWCYLWFWVFIGDLVRTGRLSQKGPCGPLLCLSLLSGFVAQSLSQLLVESAVLNEMGVNCASSKCVFWGVTFAMTLQRLKNKWSELIRVRESERILIQFWV